MLLQGVLVAWALPPGLVLVRWLHHDGARMERALLALSLGLWLHLILQGALAMVGAHHGVLPSLASTMLALLSVVLLVRQGRMTDGAAAPSPMQSRPRMLGLAVGLAALVLLDPLVGAFPHGVDWVGYAVLAEHLHERGAMVAMSGQQWWYPAGFPSMVSALMGATGSSAWAASWWLGTFVLLGLLLGMAGALHRHGAAPHALLSTLLAVGLLGKVWDSGWPTVSSMLLLPSMILFALQRSPSKQRALVYGMGTALSGLVHAAGVMLGALLLASSMLLRRPSVSAKRERAVLVVITVVVLFGGSLRLVFGPSEAEYGWQGGRAMLLWGLPLLPLGCWSAVMLRRHHEAQVLAVWLLAVWAFSLVQLLPSHRLGGVGSVVDAFYAMALYAFALPCATLLALWWSSSTQLERPEASGVLLIVGGDAHAPRLVGAVLLLGVVLGALLATTGVLALRDHQELLVVDDDDLAVASYLAGLAGEDAVYVEQAPWGEAIAAFGLNTTAGPDLGLHDGPPPVHLAATQAMLTDDVTVLRDLGVAWAITSPRGAMGWVLERSSWWEEVAVSGGARAWALRDAPASSFLGTLQPNRDACMDQSGCMVRADPWSAQRWQDPHGLGGERIVVSTSATLGLEASTIVSTSVEVCLSVERLGLLRTAEVRIGGQVLDLSGPAGHDRVCDVMQVPTEMEVRVEVAGGPWLDPSAVSGRGDRFVEDGGLRLHAITVHLP